MKKVLAVLMLMTMLLSTMLFSSSAFAETTYERREKVLVFLVQFTENFPIDPSLNYDADYDGTIKKTDSEYYNLFFGTGRDNITGIRDNTVRNYYREVSNGKLDLIPAEETKDLANDGIVRITLPYPHPTARNAADSLLVDDYQKIVLDVTKLADQHIDFSSFDTDSSGIICSNASKSSVELHTVFVFARGESGPNFRSFNNVFPVGSSNIFDNVYLYNNYMGNFSVISASFNNLGTVCHELAHSNDAVDLYQTSEVNYNCTWESLMSHGSRALPPVHLDAWHKVKMGFVTPTVINSSGDYDVYSIDLNDPSKYNVLKIPVSPPDSYDEEYFLLENRQFVGFDRGLADYYLEGGIAIWHVEEYSKQPANYVHFSKFWLKRSEIGFYFVSSDPYLQGHNVFGPNTSPSNSKRFDGTDSGVSVIVNSMNSNKITVTVKFLDEPKNLKAAADGHNINLTWDPVLYASSYEVSIDNGPFINVGTSTTYSHVASGKHSYKVRAISSINGRTGAESQTLTVKGIVYGDVNFDGAITSSDKDLVWNYCQGTVVLTNEQLVAADVDGNGKVNTTDSSYIGKYAAGTITQFPAGVMKLITYGDTDGDKVVTSTDSTLVSNYLLGDVVFTSAQMIAADVDGDNKVTSLDATYIKRYADGTIKEFIIASTVQ
ncbi:MAG: dockerin type I domain-containing protein [Bacillota bacterium]